MQAVISISHQEPPAKGMAHFWFENDFFLCQTHQDPETIYGIHLSNIEEAAGRSLILKPMKHSGADKRKRGKKKEVLTAPQPPKKKVKSEEVHLKVPRSLFEQTIATLPAPTPPLRKILWNQISASGAIITLLTENHGKISAEWCLKVIGSPVPKSVLKLFSQLTPQQYIHRWFFEFMRAYDLKQLKQIYDNPTIKRLSEIRNWTFELNFMFGTQGDPKGLFFPSVIQILLTHLRETPLQDYSLEQATSFERVRIQMRELLLQTKKYPPTSIKQQLNRGMTNILRRIVLMHWPEPFGLAVTQKWDIDLEKDEENQQFFKIMADPLIHTSLQAVRIIRGAASPKQMLTLEGFLALLWMVNFVAQIQQAGRISVNLLSRLVVSHSAHHWKNIAKFIFMEGVRMEGERFYKRQPQEEEEEESSISIPMQEGNRLKTKTTFWN